MFSWFGGPLSTEWAWWDADVLTPDGSRGGGRQGRAVPVVFRRGKGQGKHKGDTLPNTGSLKDATRLGCSQICVPGGIFVIFSTVDNGLSEKDGMLTTRDASKDSGERPHEAWTLCSPAASGRDSNQEGQGCSEGFTSMMGLDARTFSSMLVSLAEPPTVAK